MISAKLPGTCCILQAREQDAHHCCTCIRRYLSLAVYLPRTCTCYEFFALLAKGRESRRDAKTQVACVRACLLAWNALHVYAHVARSDDIDKRYPNTPIVRRKFRYDGSTFRKVSADMLFVSEPNPYMFGNRENPDDMAARSAAGWASESHNWLKSRFHFLCRIQQPAQPVLEGKLRVMNDDLVQPGGFGTHGHAEMEIATYVVEGS